MRDMIDKRNTNYHTQTGAGPSVLHGLELTCIMRDMLDKTETPTITHRQAPDRR